MKRRILPMIMAVMIILSIIQVPAWAADGDDPMETADSNELTDIGGGEPEARDGNNVAQIGDTGYPTLQAAIDAAEDGQTVTLLTTVTESVTVGESQNITLDLNGQTLTNTDGFHTIENSGTLTIIGSGIVDNVSHARAAVYNNVNATVTISGGTYTRSAENGQTTEDNGGNSYYTLVNRGTMTVDGESVQVNQGKDQVGRYSSLVENGWQNGWNDKGYDNNPKPESAATPTLIISAGTFECGLNTIKNDDFGVLQISGGTFRNSSQNTVLNANTAEITGGDFSGDKVVIYNYGYTTEPNVCTIAISDGTFSGSIVDNRSGHEGVTISGGIFSSDVSNYLSDSVKATKGANGQFVVTPLEESDPDAFAEVGGECYKSLSAAIAAAGDGDTVTLLKSVEVASRIEIADNITLDLNGKTLTSTADIGILVDSNTSFELTGGTLDHNPASGNPMSGIFVLTGATFTLASDATIESTGAGVTGTNNTANEGNATFNIYGTIDCDDVGIWGRGPNNTYNVIGATINSNYFGVYQNGSYGGCSVTIQDSTITDGITNGCGVYISNSNKNANDQTQGMQTLVIENSSITGATAVEVKYTDVTIAGENTVLTATGTPADDQLNNNGTVTTGYALAITHNGTTTSADSADGNVVVTGGIFNGEVGVQSPTQSAQTVAEVAISGGTFSSAVEDEYCAPGFEPTTTADGKHTVAVANDMTVKIVDANGNDVAAYETLDAALTHVTPGQTIALLANVEYNGKVSIPEGVTLDGNGNAITATAEITSGAFIEVMTDNVTIKDLVVNTNGKAKHGIQFYQTKGGELSGVTVNGGSYTSVIVNGSTDIRIENCTLNPGSGAYANIEYAMGSGVTTVPSVTVSNPKYDSGKPLVYVDSATIKAITNEANPSDKDIADALEQVNKNVTISGMEMVWVNGSFVARPIPTPVDPGDDDDDDNNNSGSSSVRRYDIEADAGRGGDISPDGRVRVRRGENQTFRITADDGYEIYDVEVDGESVGAVSRYTFENVREDHTISATFRQTGAQTEEAQLPFLDVAEGAWYYDAVTYCYENGIMDGTSSVSFAPGMLLNRAMAAQVLYNLADGTASTAAGFPDVAASAWYADAVNWAAANGYVTGYDNGSFGPEDSLTREQLAVILYRYAGSPEPTGSLDGFTDAASASDYAVDALRWAVGEGLLTGKDGGRLDPAGTASRAELAQILARFAQM